MSRCETVGTLRFGVYQQRKTTHAAVFAPGAEECRISLFTEDVTHPAAEYELMPAENLPGVFTADFPSDPLHICYCFATEKGAFLDPCGRGLLGAGGFGVESDTDDPLMLHGRRSLITGTMPSMAGDVRPDIPFADMVIYKLHVRSFTADASSGVRHKGTFRGVAEKIPYLKSLGINAVMLMPCYDFIEQMRAEDPFAPPERFRPAFTAYHSPESGVRLNVWGYGARADFFAPKSSFASEPDRAASEFAGLVRALHKAGIAVFMELCFVNDERDSFVSEVLRFWTHAYHIDGFRVMGAEGVLKNLASDPMLQGIRLIAGSWDGRIPSFCTETSDARLAVMQDSYMINVRRFLKGDEGQIKEFTENLRANDPQAARINYLADHDGFTLGDTYAYDERHNESNGEKNRDGREANYSWNCGSEGPTASRRVLQLRKQMIANALTVLFLSQGTPLLMAGDEFGNTHLGNNNPYCCDGPEGRVVWEKTARATELRTLTRDLIRMRHEHRAFSNRLTLKGSDYISSGFPDISFHGLKAWLPDYGYSCRTAGVLLNGEYALAGRDTPDSSFYIAFNMHWEEHTFDIPGAGPGHYEIIRSTDRDNRLIDEKTCIIRPRSIAVIELKK